MNEQPEQQRRRTKETKAVRQSDSDKERTAAAMSDRCEAVRRWIEEDDEPAVRGID